MVSEKSKTDFDFDLIVIGAGYGGFDAVKHAAESGLRAAIVEFAEMGGTCVNRGCVPSKALLAAASRIRDLSDTIHLRRFGIQSGPIHFEYQTIANHANQLVSSVRSNLTRSIEQSGAKIFKGKGRLEGLQKVGILQSNGIDRIYSARDIIIATGSKPFIPPGIKVDGRTVFTSDDAVKLDWLPGWIAIIGSGYIGLEFADIYTALGCEVTIIEALDNLMPTFDQDIARVAARRLINDRDIDIRTGLLATKVIPGFPVKIELTNRDKKNLIDQLEVDAVLVATGRIPVSQDLNLDAIGVKRDRDFIPVNDKMQVVMNNQEVPHLWAVGDVTGKMMLAHTAAAQGVIAVDNILGKNRYIDYRSIPAATFTHPEISSVGLSESDANNLADKEKFSIGIVRSYFKANSKALSELDSDGMMKLIFRQDTGEVLGAHMYGLHAADLIQEIANSISHRQSIKELVHQVHTHPTLGEVVEAGYKQALQQIH